MLPFGRGGGTSILGHGREVPRWWPSFLRFSIWLGALFSILKPLKQPGSILLTPHCVDIQSNWPPFSQFPIQLIPFFWTLSDPIGSIFQACAEPPYQNICRSNIFYPCHFCIDSDSDSEIIYISYNHNFHIHLVLK